MGLFGSDAASRIAARLMTDDDSFPTETELFAVSVRIPESLKTVIDELATDASVSRNTMIIDLLRAGVDDVLSKLPPEMAAEYYVEDL